MKMNVLNIKNKLAYAPINPPKYCVSIDSEIFADPKATRSYLALMNLAAVNGAAACHWGGPSALVEMMTVLHGQMFKSKNWFEKFNFINDVGHAENGVYALRAVLGFDNLTIDDLLGFRSIDSKLTGHGESHLNPEGVLLSNGPLSSAIGQAQGMAMADKLIGNTRITICTVSDGASMEGEAKEAFAAIPGFAKKDLINPFIMILSDNNTKLSGRIDEDSFSMQASFETFKTLGWNIIKVDNGHDLKACNEALLKAIDESLKGPSLIWLKTLKGYPIKSAMDSKSGAHGFPIKEYSEDIFSFLDEINEGETPSEFVEIANKLTQKPKNMTPSSGGEKMQSGFAKACIDMKNKGYPVVSVSSDLQGSTGMAPFHKEFKESSFDVGIAESNMVSVAAGMSKAGFIPVVDTFAAFGVTKGNLPHIMASLSDCPMIAVYSHTGFQDAADGASHQSTTYIAAMSSIPNTKVVIVASSNEAYDLMTEAIDKIKTAKENDQKASSYIFFVGRENFPSSISDEKSALAKAQVIKRGKDALIVSCGPALHQALKANLNCSIINNSSVNDIDLSTISKELKACNGKLLTVEDHQVVGGMGAQLVHALKEAGIEFKSKSLGVTGNFGQSAYSAEELYAKHNFDYQAIERAIKAF